MPARERIGGLIEELGPVASDLGCEAGLAAAEKLCERNGAIRQREVAADQGVAGLVAWLGDNFTA
jgi:hypothetical protein